MTVWVAAPNDSIKADQESAATIVPLALHAAQIAQDGGVSITRPLFQAAPKPAALGVLQGTRSSPIGG